MGGEKKELCPIDSNPCHVSRGQKTWNFCDNIHMVDRPPCSEVKLERKERPLKKD
jgi:hypothetical protein